MKIRLLMILCTALIAPLFSSCAALTSAVTKTPVPTTPVQRVDKTGVAFNVATADLALAEAAPTKAYGLYDAGQAADILGSVGKSSSTTSSAKPSVDLASSK